LDNSECDRFVIKVDSVKGRSVYTKTPIKEGAFVASYKGELINGREARSREFSLPEKLGSFIFYFNFNGKNFAIDATKEPASTEDSCGRLINHSKLHSNITPRILVIDDIPKIVFLAKCHIAVNCELLYNYNDFRSRVIKSFPFLRT